VAKLFEKLDVSTDFVAHLLVARRSIIKKLLRHPTAVEKIVIAAV